MADNKVIDLIIEPATKDLGEFTVRRSLPDPRRQRVGPFIFFDHMGPAEFPPGAGVNVRAHPHIGLATITYLFEGEILHRDNLGFVQAIRPGAVNWMTAGKGIVHSEKVTPELKASGQKLHGLQVWVALPTEKEEVEPRFEHYPDEEIPWVDMAAARARIVIGTAFGATSPVKTESETLYVEVNLEAGGELELPVVEELGVYVIDGTIELDGRTIADGVLAVLHSNACASIASTPGARVMLFGGAALEGDRILWWNFVSSSRERMNQAKKDWKEGHFPAVPGEVDFIPLPSK
jgi:redox-sensitive bicupin YhaK (pirin superfamily)